MNRAADEDAVSVDDAPPSKTQRKREAQSLQELGAALLELPEERLARLDLDEQLREALDAMRRTRGREAQRRQMQYIGKRLRLVDAEPLRRAVDDARALRVRGARAFQRVEQWRDRLLADDHALTEWMNAHADTPLQALRNLIRNARRERAELSADDGRQVGRYGRELFRLLREVLERSGG